MKLENIGNILLKKKIMHISKGKMSLMSLHVKGEKNN